MAKLLIGGIFSLAATLAVQPCARAQSPSNLPRLQLSDFQYLGAFRVPSSTFGASNMNYSEGPIEYNASNHSLFMVGHSHHQAIAEFAVPELVHSSTVTDLNMSPGPLQVFSTVLDRVNGGNPQDINRISGMELLGGTSLLVNGYEYYDAPADNTHTSLVIKNSSNIASSSIEGFYRLPGSAHASGWISPVPPEWRTLLGGTHITGHSSGIPIIGRTSVGPSAFSFTPGTIVQSNPVPDPFPTNTLLDFSLNHPLHTDLSNNSLTNNLWTHLSRAVYGFIVPGTRTYVTLGYSGGHNSGVCYKCTQNNNNTCGGYCAPDAEDYYHYYWLWDLNDLLAVKNGDRSSYDVMPYDYGVFPTPFSTSQLGGGSFDPESGKLYLTVQRADENQGQYSNPPIVVVYQFNPSSDTRRTPGDWDGDGKTDFTVIRPAANAQWFTRYSSSDSTRVSHWGYNWADLFLDIDSNGDGKSDQNATRARTPSSNIEWYTLQSPTYSPSQALWGEPGDIPLSADFDGDGTSDLVIYRPSDGTWWIVRSRDGFLHK
ncbi:MAG: hypothetical protein KDD66_15735, partial [Bdellovibrionales bacterium]|nr:hypothetical protein [Bdellovibrionales bacterium]